MPDINPIIMMKLGLKTAIIIGKLYNDGYIDDKYVVFDEAFCLNLGLSSFQGRGIREKCKILGLLNEVREGKPNRIKVSVSSIRYGQILTEDKQDYGFRK